jgi:hypothetical protein
MAIARIPAWSITWLDSSGSSGTTRGNMQPGGSAAAALASVATLASVMAAATDCVAVRRAVTYRIIEQPPIARGHTGVAQNVGLFVWTTDSGDDLAIVRLPGLPSSALLTTGPFAGEWIDLANSEIAAVVELLADGPWSDPFGAGLIEVQAAYLRIEE